MDSLSLLPQARQLVKHLEKLNEFALDFLFPIRCLCCRAYCGTFFCLSCASHIPLSTQHACPQCQTAQTVYGKTCPACYGKTALDGVYWTVSFEDPIIKTAIHRFKYQFIPSLADPLGEICLRGLRSIDIPLPDLIVSVPLHHRRLRWRGFNQAALLGKYIAKNLLSGQELEFSDTLLFRRRFTLPQAKNHTRKVRMKNLKNAFEIDTNTPDIAGKRIWIIDDVSTTNATLSGCGDVLKKAGAKEVWGIVIAH